jgi:excinuclease ABC subunit C
MKKIKFIKEKNWESLPKTSGVYFFYNKKELLYIGKAINIKNRVKNHFLQPSYRDKFFIEKINKIGFMKTYSEIEALILEANLIKKHQPKFNVVWRDDKNYFFVAIVQNKEKIPYVFITHQPTETKNAQYIGPFVEGASLKKTIRFLRKVFPYYTNKTHSKLKCTWCHLDLCPGPDPDLKNYKNNIKKLVLVLKGKSRAVLKSLKREMQTLSKASRFEEAGKARDKIYALQNIMSHTSVINRESNYSDLSENFTAVKFSDKKLKQPPATFFPSPGGSEILAGILGIKSISRIECYDISNIQGNFATGSIAVFINGNPDKSKYRKFKIKIDGKPNDIAMLKEVLQRRFAHKEWEYPQVILIDGGKAQLNIAIKTKNQRPKTKDIKAISIAKRNKELFVEGRKKPILLKTLPREVYNLILHLDDEAHRFAIAFHKKIRKKNLLKN